MKVAPDRKAISTDASPDRSSMPQQAARAAEKKPRLLFLCQTLPFPPNTGVTIRTFNVLRLLADTYDITALCFFRRASKKSEREVAGAIAGLRAVAVVEAFPIPQEYSRLRLLGDHLASLVTRRPYTVYAYSSDAFRKRLRDLVGQRTFDLVHLDSLDLSVYLPELGNIPVVCVHHNVESHLLRRRSAAEQNPLHRAYIRHQAALTEREEVRWCEQIALNVVVSQADHASLRDLAPGANIVVAPNGVDTSLLRPVETDGVNERRLVFVGGHGWFPNADALDYFCTDILPLVRAAHPKVEVHWVGRAPAAIVQEYSRKYGINVTGFVEDMRPEVWQAACYIVPLRVGGGTRLKILDAWALGKAVVSTSIGCEGLDARHEENILIADTPRDFAAAIGCVLTHRDLRLRLGQNARETAVTQYDWEIIGRRMKAAYEAVRHH